MARRSSARVKVSVHPLTADRWDDFELLFGKKGACGGCWCMFWRLNRGDFNRLKGDGTRLEMKRLVDSNGTPGLLAYKGDEPIGWCSVAPRGQYPGLQRSRLFKPLDAEPVWSVSCLFIAKPYRRKGVSVQLLKAAVEHVRLQGGRIVEAYPQEPKGKTVPDVFAWTGLASAFRRVGFQECARPSPTRPIMRFAISGNSF